MTALWNIIATGLLGGILTTLAVMLFAALEKESPFTPVNAVAHIAFGDEAIGINRPIPKYLFTGLILNLGAILSWAAVQELLFWVTKWRSDSLAYAWMSALIVTVIAYIVDFYIVPKRLTPGFERVLSRRSLYFTYLVLALGLAIGALMRQPL